MGVELYAVSIMMRGTEKIKQWPPKADGGLLDKMAAGPGPHEQGEIFSGRERGHGPPFIPRSYPGPTTDVISTRPVPR